MEQEGGSVAATMSSGTCFAELFSCIRLIAMNNFTNDKVFKAGPRRKIRETAMNRNHLASVLAECGLS